VVKSPEVLKSETEFLKKAEAKAGSRAEAEWSLRKSGWLAVWNKRYREAALRLNQAWLIDPEQGDTYYGLAIVAWQRDKDLARAEELFRMALARPREVGLINLQYGSLLLARGRPGEAVPHLRAEAEGRFGSGEAQGLLVVALDASGDHASACRELPNVRPQAIKEDLLAEVRRRTAECPKPQ
jgi:predicted Zn-dependent protease